MSKKYEYSANDFTHTDSAINVQICVAPSNFNLLPIFTISVPVEKKDGEDIDYYRTEAIKKAKEVIADIAEDAEQGDLHQNEGVFSGVVFVNSGDLSLEERVTALEKQLTDMQAAMSCDIKVGFVNHAGIKVLPVHINSAKNMNIDSDIIAVDKANEIIFFRDQSSQ